MHPNDQRVFRAIGFFPPRGDFVMTSWEKIIFRQAHVFGKIESRNKSRTSIQLISPPFGIAGPEGSLGKLRLSSLGTCVFYVLGRVGHLRFLCFGSRRAFALFRVWIVSGICAFGAFASRRHFQSLMEMRCLAGNV